jgi:hypothetical protein
VTAFELTAGALKDEHLFELGSVFNVARFASFGPRDAAVRYARLGPDAAPPTSIASAAVELLALAPSVNIRTFRPGSPKGNPFVYGITAAADAVAAVGRFASDGWYTIVNETIDVADGGVSGVTLGDLTEFAPGGTPRVVEEPGVAAMRSDVAAAVLGAVYGADLPWRHRRAWRVEFSVHPRPVGCRRQVTVVWEAEDVGEHVLAARTTWPNRFSRSIGDKTFGLLLATGLGARVPRTMVLARDVRPFSFGHGTGSGAVWVRTAPREFAAGEFTTVRGWTDPFALLAAEDPRAEHIGAVLVQDAVVADWSGAAHVRGSEWLVEGVRGAGDRFMLGSDAPQELPAVVRALVRESFTPLVDEVGPARIEWAVGRDGAWLLQLNPIVGGPGVADHDRASGWIDFDPHAGLEALQLAIAQARAAGAGIRVVRPVGVTSHVGDLVRRAGLPLVVAR